MMLFKARNKARAELDAALQESGLDEETFKKRSASSRRLKSPFYYPPHKAAGVVANPVYALS